MSLPNLLIISSILFSIQAFASPLDETNLGAETNSENYQEIDFSTLHSHVIYKEIEDPFWELDYVVLDKLAVIVDYQDAKAAGKTMSKQQNQEYDELKTELENQAIDVEGLLDVRQQLIVQWQIENESVNPLIINKNIQIQGFILPIEWQGKELAEFLLVPFVGACIHQPAPPPNQIIYAKLNTPTSIPELNTFSLVTIKGLLTSELQSPKINLVDGTEPVTTSYELNAVTIEVNTDSMYEL